MRLRIEELIRETYSREPHTRVPEFIERSARHNLLHGVPTQLRSADAGCFRLYQFPGTISASDHVNPVVAGPRRPIALISALRPQHAREALEVLPLHPQCHV